MWKIVNKNSEKKIAAGEQQDFFGQAARGEHAPLKPLEENYTPQQQSMLDIFNKHKGHFDEHIETSIPHFRKNSLGKMNAIVQSHPQNARMLDIASSEGSLGKTITEASGGRIQTTNLDPQEQMINTFKTKSQVPGAESVSAAFGASFEDENGKIVPKFAPPHSYDVVHESMAFQFFGPEREEHISEAKRLLAPDGIFLSEEKVRTNNEAENEAKKDAWKAQYHTPEALQRKQEQVGFQGEDTGGGGMMDKMVHQDVLESLLKKYFKYVVQYWSSGNFKGYAASDSKDKINAYVNNYEFEPHQFETERVPRSLSSSSKKSKWKMSTNKKKTHHKFKTSIKDHKQSVKYYGSLKTHNVKNFKKKSVLNEQQAKELFSGDNQFLYHSVNHGGDNPDEYEDAMSSIFQHGILPRTQTGKSSYHGWYESRPHHAYLGTRDKYSPVAAPQLMVDMSMVDPQMVKPDEDYAFRSIRKTSDEDLAKMGVEFPQGNPKYQSLGQWMDEHGHVLDTHENVKGSIDKEASIAVRGGVPADAVYFSNEHIENKLNEITEDIQNIFNYMKSNNPLDEKDLLKKVLEIKSQKNIRELEFFLKFKNKIHNPELINKIKSMIEEINDANVQIENVKKSKWKIAANPATEKRIQNMVDKAKSLGYEVEQKEYEHGGIMTDIHVGEFDTGYEPTTEMIYIYHGGYKTQVRFYDKRLGSDNVISLATADSLINQLEPANPPEWHSWHENYEDKGPQRLFLGTPGQRGMAIGDGAADTTFEAVPDIHDPEEDEQIQYVDGKKKKWKMVRPKDNPQPATYKDPKSGWGFYSKWKKVSVPPAEQVKEFSKGFEQAQTPKELKHKYPVRGHRWELDPANLERLYTHPEWPLKTPYYVHALSKEDIGRPRGVKSMDEWSSLMGEHHPPGEKKAGIKSGAIYINPLLSSEAANEALWHELQHAYQHQEKRWGEHERYTNPVELHRMGLSDEEIAQKMKEYYEHPMELDANAFADFMRQYPLIRETEPYYNPNWVPEEHRKNPNKVIDNYYAQHGSKHRLRLPSIKSKWKVFSTDLYHTSPQKNLTILNPNMTGGYTTDASLTKKYYPTWPIFLSTKLYNPNDKAYETSLSKLDQTAIKADLPSLQDYGLIIEENDTGWFDPSTPESLKHLEDEDGTINLYELVNDWKNAFKVTNTIAYLKPIQVKQSKWKIANKDAWEAVLDGELGHDIITTGTWEEVKKQTIKWLKQLENGYINKKNPHDNQKIDSEAKEQDGHALEDLKLYEEKKRWSFHFDHGKHPYDLIIQPVGYKESKWIRKEAPARSKAQFRYMQGICNGSIEPPEGMTRAQACEYVEGQKDYKSLPDRAEKESSAQKYEKYKETEDTLMRIGFNQKEAKTIALTDMSKYSYWIDGYHAAVGMRDPETGQWHMDVGFNDKLTHGGVTADYINDLGTPAMRKMIGDKDSRTDYYNLHTARGLYDPKTKDFIHFSHPDAWDEKEFNFKDLSEDQRKQMEKFWRELAEQNGIDIDTVRILNNNTGHFEDLDVSISDLKPTEEFREQMAKMNLAPKTIDEQRQRVKELIESGMSQTDAMNKVLLEEWRLKYKKEFERGGKAVYATKWEKISKPNLVPPQGVRAAARRGIAYHAKGKAGDGFESATLQRAHKIAEGQELTPEHVKRMHSFFERHAGGRSQKAKKGEITPWDVAWLAWGGNAGRTWAASKVKELENSEKTSKKKCDCWDGYCRVPGTKPCEPGSCEKCDAARKNSKWKIADYQGWTNWETWNVNLMMQNEYALSKHFHNLVASGASGNQFIADAIGMVIGPYNQQLQEDFSSMTDDEEVEMMKKNQEEDWWRNAEKHHPDDYLAQEDYVRKMKELTTQLIGEPEPTDIANHWIDESKVNWKEIYNYWKRNAEAEGNQIISKRKVC